MIHKGGPHLLVDPFFMPKIASHLKRSRHGVFYFRIRVPQYLKEKIGADEIVRSLRTHSPIQAKRLVYDYASHYHRLFDAMKKFNPNDPSTWNFDDGSIRTYDADFQKGVFRSGDAEDHARMMEVMKLYQSIERMRAENPPKPPPIEFTPQAVPITGLKPLLTPPHTKKLEDAITEYTPTIITPKSRKSNETNLNAFLRWKGNVNVHEITGVDIVTYNALLMKTVAPRTADGRIQFIQSLLKYCQKNLYIHEDANLPTKGKFNLTRKQIKKTTKGAELFSIEQLNLIFNPETYLPWCKHKPSRYWMPLIALFTGMRKEEVAQLRHYDILEENGIAYFDVSDSEGRSLKTDNAKRKIPIHSRLLDLGFMDYVRSRRGPLFTDSGGAVSHAFIRYLEEIGVKKKGDLRAMVFHSLRDTFNQRLFDNTSVQELIRLELMGHSSGGRVDNTNKDDYLEKFTVEQKHRAIEGMVLAKTVGGTHYELRDLPIFEGGKGGNP